MRGLAPENRQVKYLHSHTVQVVDDFVESK